MLLNIKELLAQVKEPIKSLYKSKKQFQQQAFRPTVNFDSPATNPKSTVTKFKRDNDSQNSWIQFEHGYLCLNIHDWIGRGGWGHIKTCLYYQTYDDIESDNYKLMIVKIGAIDDSKHSKDNALIPTPNLPIEKRR